MTTPIEILRSARHVVVQDYPRSGIPDDLARAGLQVTVYGGPDEADVVAHDLVDGETVIRAVGRRPDTADLLYVFRPLAELDDIVADARRMGARTIWRQPDPTGDDPDGAEWRSRVEAAGLTYLDSPEIDEVARQLVRES